MPAPRSHTSRPIADRPARALTAAARRLDLSTRAGRKRLPRSQPWQSEAWAYFDLLALAGFAINFMGNAASRVRVYPAIQQAADEGPVSLLDAADGDEADPALVSLADDAADEMARLDNSVGGFPSIMRGLAQCLTCVGEAVLAGVPTTDDDLRDEEWGAYSVDALKVRGDRTYLLADENDKQGTLLPDDALTYRIWRPHPRWPGRAHSNMRSVLADCQELMIYSRAFRAIAKSRAHAGALTWPTELNGPQAQRIADGATDAADADEDDTTGAEQALEALADAMTTAIEDDDSVAQVAPTLLEGAYQYLDRVGLIDIARSIDPKALERVGQLIENFARGVDLPAEIITGLAASNHWTAWAIDDDTYKAHVEPLVSAIASGICAAFLQPALLERGHSPDLVVRVQLALDPSALTTRPNRAQDAKDAHDRWAISDEALLRYLDFPETDAPSKDELLLRLALRRGIGSVGLTGMLLEETEMLSEIDSERLLAPRATAADQPAEDGPGGSGAGTGEEGGEPLPDTEQQAVAAAAALRALMPARRPQRPVTAAEHDRDRGVDAAVAGVAAALAATETRVRDRLVVAASAAVTDALRVAGQRLRRAAQGDPTLRDQVNGIPADQVGIVLGPAVVGELADPDSLLDGAFTTLGDQWDAWVAAAQGDIARQLARLPAGPVPLGAVIPGYEAAAENDRNAGWAVLAGALAAFTRARLTAGAPSMVEGEHDPSTSVPAGIVRDALAQAGGSTAGLLPGGPAARSGPGGLTTGPRVLGVLGQLNVRLDGWRWTVGMPAYPFEPHQRLAGAVFTAWDDPVLANPGAWPPVPFFSPGDHQGCQCDAVMQLTAEPAGEAQIDAA